MYIVTYIQLVFDTKKSLLDPVDTERHILGYCETFEQGKEYVLKYHNGRHKHCTESDYKSEVVITQENKNGICSIKAEKVWDDDINEETRQHVEEEIKCCNLKSLNTDPFADINDIYTS